jgi:copper(I)-binding protein
MLRLSRGPSWPLFAFSILLLLAVPAAAQHEAQTYKAGSLTIDSPWTRATPGSAKVAGGYVRIVNDGSAPDRLIGGSTSIAGRIEIHEMSLSDGIMRMRPLNAGLEIKPGASVELAPGGYHVMFMDLKQRLKEGESFKATLQFEKAGAVEVTFRVGSVGEGAGAAKHGH